MKLFLKWTSLTPILAWVLYFSGLIEKGAVFQIAACLLLIFSVMSAVHHSEVIAHRVGEPYGTIILAVAITVIEVSIIVSLMLSGGDEASALARDTVYAATMLILNGIMGLCLLIGGLRFHEQSFSRHSATIALVSLVSIIILTLVFPTFTTSRVGPYYSRPQLIFVSVACLIIYSFFLLAQTTRHREYFLDSNEKRPVGEKTTVNNKLFSVSLIMLLVSLGIVVMLAKTLSPTIERIVLSYQLPKTLVGVIIAAVILLPEGAAAVMAARKNKLQNSINLALGSALASIGLTIPCVSVVSIVFDMHIVLGLDIKSIILLGLSVFIVMLSLVTGRSNIVYGAVLLVNLLAFIFLIIYP